MVYNNTQQAPVTGDKVRRLTTGLYIILGLVGLILLSFSVMKYVR